MLKAGVLGAGHLGKIHLKLLNQSSKYELVGFYDPVKENALKVSEEFGYKIFDTIEELVENTDVTASKLKRSILENEKEFLTMERYRNLMVEAWKQNEIYSKMRTKIYLLDYALHH